MVVLLIAVWLVLPLGGCELADHAGESGWLALCDCQWPLALCQWASGFGGAGPWGSPSSEASGVVFLLVGELALGPVELSVLARWRWRPAAARSTVRRTLGSLAAATTAAAASSFAGPRIFFKKMDLFSS